MEIILIIIAFLLGFGICMRFNCDGGKTTPEVQQKKIDISNNLDKIHPSWLLPSQTLRFYPFWENNVCKDDVYVGTCINNDPDSCTMLIDFRKSQQVYSYSSPALKNFHLLNPHVKKQVKMQEKEIINNIQKNQNSPRSNGEIGPEVR